MRILFITPPPYLPNRLHRNRSFDLIRILSRKHEVHLLSAISDKKVYPEFSEIKRVCKSVKVINISSLKALTHCLFAPFLPFEVAYCKSNKAQEAIREIVLNKKIDVIYLKRLRGAIFLPDLSIPVVVDTTDAMSMFYQRMAENAYFFKKLFYQFESIKYRLFEKKIMSRYKSWVVCSDIDKKYLKNLDVDVRVEIVPNPVDVDYFSPTKVPAEANSLLFRGLMDKPVNLDAIHFFVSEISPILREKVKDFKLYIVGPKPAKSVRRLEDGKNIFVCGFVKDVREYLAKTYVSICPVRIASGTRFKILQSWASGRPVVSTSIGASGLDYEEGKNIEIADTPKKFADKIIKIFRDKNHYNKLVKNAVSTAKLRYSFGAVAVTLEKVLKNVRQ